MRLILILSLIFISDICFSQRVYEKSAKIILDKFDGLREDGQLYFEIEVRMADCLSHLEFSDASKIKSKKTIADKVHDWWWFKVREIYDFEVSQTFTKEIHEDDYSLRDTDDFSERIVMKCSLMRLQSVFPRKRFKRKIQLLIYSKSGKLIYSKIFILDKLKLIEEGEVRLGIEPS
jgi:hypothetical protein